MRIIALVGLALRTAPGIAIAKGPLSGSVSGPAVATPIKLDGTGEWDENLPARAAHRRRRHLRPQRAPAAAAG
jgi:hypothetical protein